MAYFNRDSFAVRSSSVQLILKTSSPLEYIQQERIELAKRVMANTSLSITEVCYETGFNNLNYFIRLFKRKEGVTPNVYRQ
jgi:AraC-like DNA-binding protein